MARHRPGASRHVHVCRQSAHSGAALQAAQTPTGPYRPPVWGRQVPIGYRSACYPGSTLPMGAPGGPCRPVIWNDAPPLSHAAMCVAEGPPPRASAVARPRRAWDHIRLQPGYVRLQPGIPTVACGTSASCEMRVMRTPVARVSRVRKAPPFGALRNISVAIPAASVAPSASALVVSSLG